MSFDKAGPDYDRFMGRYSAALAPLLTDQAGIRAGMVPAKRAVDVGCGTGILTAVLAERLGADHVAAIEPSPQFMAACRDRVPGADVRSGVAEALPWPDASYDAALSSLAIGFMADPAAGVREMARVTRPGGLVAVCFWDIHGGRQRMLDLLARGIRLVRPDLDGRQPRFGARRGDLATALEGAGLALVEDGELTCTVRYADFADFWEPVTCGVGPLGEALLAMDAAERDAVQDFCRRELPDGPFDLEATAWAAVGRCPDA